MPSRAEMKYAGQKHYDKKPDYHEPEDGELWHLARIIVVLLTEGLEKGRDALNAYQGLQFLDRFEDYIPEWVKERPGVWRFTSPPDLVTLVAAMLVVRRDSARHIHPEDYREMVAAFFAAKPKDIERPIRPSELLYRDK